MINETGHEASAASLEIFDEASDINSSIMSRRAREAAMNKRITRMAYDRFPSDAVEKRKAPNGKDLSYADQHYVQTRLNDVFGVTGWADTIIYNKCVSEEQEEVNGKVRWCVSYEAKVRIRVTAAGFSYASMWHEGTGNGHGFGARKGDAVESACKEAETDALKRAAKKFGPSFGLALYDKTQEDVGKMLYDNEGVPLRTAYDNAVYAVTGAKDLHELYEVVSDKVRPLTRRLDAADVSALQKVYKERLAALKAE
jgi:recombination DNA repair RAD52 pathway protein